jgi:hypothetical protein
MGQSAIAAHRQVHLGELDRSCSAAPIAAATASQAKQLSLMILHRIVSDNRSFILQRPILVRLDFRAGWWTHEYAPWGIAGCGETENASLEEFCIYFACTWDGLVHESDANLTVDAQNLKDLLRRQVTLVE